MKAISVSVVLAGLMIPAAIVSAQPEMDGLPEKKGPDAREEGPKGEAGPKREGGPRERRFGKGWREADADNSGTISREEFNNLPRIQKLPEEKRDNIFNRVDKDKDGVLSEEELKMMMRPPHEGREAMMRFRELDTDNSGGVSLEELKAGELFKKLPAEKQEALFARLDTDGDGQITVKDRPGPPRDGPGRPDRPGKPDRDGKPDRPEKEGRPDKDGRNGRPDKPSRDPRQMLKDLDEDQDGSVSFEEFRKAPPQRNLGEDEQEDRFEALDKNHDKKLDEADFPASPKPEEGADKDKPAPPPAGE